MWKGTLGRRFTLFYVPESGRSFMSHSSAPICTIPLISHWGQCVTSALFPSLVSWRRVLDRSCRLQPIDVSFGRFRKCLLMVRKADVFNVPFSNLGLPCFFGLFALAPVRSDPPSLRLVSSSDTVGLPDLSGPRGPDSPKLWLTAYNRGRSRSAADPLLSFLRAFYVELSAIESHSKRLYAAAWSLGVTDVPGSRRVGARRFHG